MSKNETSPDFSFPTISMDSDTDSQPPQKPLDTRSSSTSPTLKETSPVDNNDNTDSDSVDMTTFSFGTITLDPSLENSETTQDSSDDQLPSVTDVNFSHPESTPNTTDENHTHEESEKYPEESSYSGFFENSENPDYLYTDEDDEEFLYEVKNYWKTSNTPPPVRGTNNVLVETEATPNVEHYKKTERWTELLDGILFDAIEQGASDVYIPSDNYVFFKILGETLRQPQYGLLDPVSVERMMSSSLLSVDNSEFSIEMELDTSYELRSTAHYGRRVRVNAGRSFDSPFMAMRIISNTIPTIDQIGIPEQVRQWFNQPKGLILVNGPTGTGKTTTIASILNHKVQTEPITMLTIEKPVEFIYPQTGKGITIQREVNLDTKGFSRGLDSGMRQNPNIILVGEIRNREEIDQFLRAAETGHLSVSTIHTVSTVETIGRIRSNYTEHDQYRVLDTLASTGIGFVNQVLVRTPDKKSRFAVMEVLEFTPDVRQAVRKGDTETLFKILYESEQSMEHALVREVNNGRVSKEEARRNSTRPDIFDKLLKGEPIL